MDNALTLTTLAQIFAFIGAALALWWRVENRISSGEKDALEKADKAQRELNDFRLEVAQDYVKYGFINAVENRLGSRFDAIVAELHGMRGDFHKVMVNIASQSKSRTRP